MINKFPAEVIWQNTVLWVSFVGKNFRKFRVSVVFSMKINVELVPDTVTS